MGPKGASPGRAGLSSGALDPVRAQAAVRLPDRPKEVLPFSGHCLGCSQDSGQVHGEQRLLATPSAAQWEQQLILIKSPPSFCKEAGSLGLGGWVV